MSPMVVLVFVDKILLVRLIYLFGIIIISTLLGGHGGPAQKDAHIVMAYLP